MKHHKYNLGYSVLLVLFLSASLMAQKPKITFNSINQTVGLCNGTVQTLFEDSFGFIWIGTHHGVQRYDGKSFVNYEHMSGDTAGLSSNYINSFCEDEDKNIWISTGNGLNKYVREKDLILRYRLSSEEVIKNGYRSIFRIINDQSDKNILWMTVANVGLVSLNIKTDSLTIFPIPSYHEVFPLWILNHPEDENKLLLGSPELLSFDKTNGAFTSLLKLEQNAKIPNNWINDAKIDPVDREIIWLATGDFWGRGNLGGLIRFNMKTKEKKLYSPRNRNDFPDNNILTLGFSDHENLWVGTRNNGVLLFNTNGENKFYNYQRNAYDEGSFVTENAVRSMLYDRSGTMWYGTWGDGIALLSPTVQKFKHYMSIPGQKNGLPDNFITSFTEDKNGFIWIGTDKGGLSKFNPIDKSFENYFPEFSPGGKFATSINYLFYDSRDYLWIGTYSEALFRMNPNTGETIHYKKGNTEKNVSQKRISAIAEFVPGEIMISTYGGGLNIYHYQTNSFRHYLNNPSDSTSLPDNQVWLPVLAKDGNYYFSGNSSVGLIQFNPKSETFKEMKPQVGMATFMMPAVTSSGRIFVDEVSEGLREIVLEPELNVITQYDSQGQSLKNLESIIAIDDELWMGTGNGLVHYNPDTKVTRRYFDTDGLQDNRFNRFAFFKSSTGDCYIGGHNGFSTFHPDQIKLSKYKPSIVFTDFKLFQQKVPIGDDSPLEKSILLVDHLELKHNQNDFSISFAALDYSNPQKIEYKYILENHDADWIYAGNFNSAGYTNMDPGEYTLKVMATNSDGVWSDNIASMRIKIHPPWYQTNFAYFIYVLIFILGVVIVDRVQRLRLKEKERAKAREKELEQAKEIEHAYNKLKNTQKQLIQAEKMASLGELTAGIAHEIQNPLNFVNNFSEVSADLTEELQEELQKGDTEEVKAIADDLLENLNKINHHGQRASNIVKGMLEHSRTGSGEKVPTDLNSLADEYLRLAYHGLRAKNKTFNADFKLEADPDLPLLNMVAQDIGRVLLNLINNAFYAISEKARESKDDYKPQVVVNTVKLDHGIEIRVKDNGNGIPDTVKEKIFQPFFTTKPTGQGTGLGLSMSYDIITKGHNGALKVETMPGKGTEFIIELPTKI